MASVGLARLFSYAFAKKTKEKFPMEEAAFRCYDAF
jgi:hypothetical protein